MILEDAAVAPLPLVFLRLAALWWLSCKRGVAFEQVVSPRLAIGLRAAFPGWCRRQLSVRLLPPQEDGSASPGMPPCPGIAVLPPSPLLSDAGHIGIGAVASSVLIERRSTMSVPSECGIA